MNISETRGLFIVQGMKSFGISGEDAQVINRWRRKINGAASLESGH